jgi:multidrug efflux pump subunit AcrB
MMRIILFFIHRPKVANLLMISILLLGVIGMLRVQNQGYPPVDFGVVNITTVYPGASPEDVDEKVTVMLEDQLDGIKGIKEMTSMSIDSLSQISIRLEDNINQDKVRQEIRDAVDNVQDLPKEVTKRPHIVEVNNNRIPVVELSLTGTVSEQALRRYANTLEDILRTEPLIGTISKLGYREREVHINVDPKKLEKKYVSLLQLEQAIKARNIQESMGDIFMDGVLKKIQLDESFETALDVSKVVIRSGFDGNRVIVSDVAQVVDGFEETKKRYRFNSQDAINIIVFKKENSDLLAVSDSVEKLVDTFKKQLPNSVQLFTIVDYSDDARRLLDLVIRNALLGLVLVIATLIIFLNRHVAFWTALGIPISILFAFIIFPFVGVTINFISLMGMIIVLGILVDDAIIIAENIYRYKQEGLPGVEAAIKGTKEVLWPVITTIITTIIAFSPLIIMTGTMGKFMWSMPVVVSLVLIGSLIESLFILPSHIAHAKNIAPSKRLQQWGNKCKEYYRRCVMTVLNNSLKTVVVFILILVASITLLVKKMDFVLFDSKDGMVAIITYELPVGTPIHKTIEKTKEIEEIISQFPKKYWRTYVTTVGEKGPLIASRGQDLNNESVGNIVIHLTDIGLRDKTAQQIIKRLDKKLNELEGFKSISAEKISEGPPVGRAITVSVVSNNDKHRQDVIDEIKTFLSRISSVYNMSDNQGVGKTKVEVRLNQDQLSRLGVTTQQVADTLRMAYYGRVITSIRQNGEDLDYRIQIDPKNKQGVESLTQLNVLNHRNQLIPLHHVIQFDEVPDILQYRRLNSDRAVTIYADINEEAEETVLTTSLKVNQALRQTLAPILAQYTDVRLEMGGQEKETKESMKNLSIALAMALLGIYFILVILFDSFAQPLLVIIAIPFSFSGIVFTFYFHDIPFGFMAILGLIGLTGIVVNDSLILISMINTRVKERGHSMAVIADAATLRLRPIMLTTITTAAGLMPTAYGFGGDNPFLVPMIMAMAWGLIFATIITLILVPSLYWIQCQCTIRLRRGSQDVQSTY